MSVVLLVGAGGSLAQAISYRPVRTREHPPLDTDFFVKAIRLSKVHDEVERSIQSIRDELSKSGRFADPFDEPGRVSLEQFFADVYYEVAAARSGDAFDIYVSLLQLYTLVLGTTTNWLANRPHLGDLDRIIRIEHERSDGDLTICTFNQDLVIENIVARLPRTIGQWCLSSLYNNPNLGPLYARETDHFLHHEANCPHSPPVTLLKLHGSLNWGVRSRDQAPRMGTLFPQQNRQIFLHNSKLSAHSATMSTTTQRGRKTWYLWPLIVPPIYDKGRITGISVLDSVWGDAVDAIANCSRLILVGYSVPDADVLASQMLRRSFQQNENLDEIECINPDASVVGKLQEKLNCRVVRLYENLQAYLKFSGGPA